jgi:four helix bundle protein
MVDHVCSKESTIPKSYFKNWMAYRKGFLLQREIRKIALCFPPAEKFSLTDQIKRSSRSVCSNLAESFAKRCYPKHFIAKLTDAAGENYETQAWLDVTLDEGYIKRATYDELIRKSEEVGKLLSYMENNPSQY